MDRVDNYRQIVKEVLREYAHYRPATGDIDLETIFDEMTDHYELLAVGWRDKQRVHGCSFTSIFGTARCGCNTTAPMPPSLISWLRVASRLTPSCWASSQNISVNTAALLCNSAV